MLMTVGRIYDSKDAADYGMLRMLLAHGADPNFEYAGTPMIQLATSLSNIVSSNYYSSTMYGWSQRAITNQTCLAGPWTTSKW